jgi:hypothetical protein
MLLGCAGATGSSKSLASGSNTSSAGILAVSPPVLNFGNVAVGTNATLSGTLSATDSDVTVSSATWSGSGYSVSGITFPVTIAAGKSAKFAVTFAPPDSGSSSGSISFSSDASDAIPNQSFSGTGFGTGVQHSVTLSWNPSTSKVSGYNIYRATEAGGPYSRLSSSVVSESSYSDSTVQSGTTYYYVSTAVDANNVESAYSNQATAIIP